MATSGVTTFTMNTRQIIVRALNLLGVVGVDQYMQGNDYSLVKDFLNMYISHLTKRGVSLTFYQQATLIPEYNTSEYIISSTGAHCSTEVIKTELSQAGATSDTLLHVDSTTSMTVGDYIVIELTNKSLFSTTIATIPTSTTLTLTTGLTSAAAINNNVYTYTTKLARPVEIVQAILSFDTGINTELQMMNREEFYATNQPTIKSVIGGCFYDLKTTYGVVNLYPVPDQSNYLINLTVKRQLQYFSDSTDDVDLDSGALLMLVYNLAVLVAPFCNKVEKGKALEAKALMFEQQFLMSDADVNLIVDPSEEWSGRG